MGEAKHRRASGAQMGNTEEEREYAKQNELRRIERQRNGVALNQRRDAVYLPPLKRQRKRQARNG